MSQSPTSRPAAPQPAPPRVPYQAPRLTSLGRWEAVTLIYSVPLGPAGATLQHPPTY